MQEILKNNKEFYNQLYNNEKIVEYITAQMNNFLPFFINTTANKINYFALYHDNFAQHLKNKKVFEIGAGQGLNALFMAKWGAEVVTNDISENSAKIIQTMAKKLQLDDKIHSIEGEFLNIDLPEKEFDFVIGKGFLHHLPHELEELYLHKIASLLKVGGVAKFAEPAHNRPLLRKLRLMLPAKDRPSSLNKKAFSLWQKKDRHPQRNNSSAHYAKCGKNYFSTVKIIPLGALYRCNKIAPKVFKQNFRQWHPFEEKMPYWLRSKLALSQLIVCYK